MIRKNNQITGLSFNSFEYTKTEPSTQIEPSQKYIYIFKSLRSRSTNKIYNNEKKIKIKLEKFHHNFLRNSIHSNEKYKNFFETQIQFHKVKLPNYISNYNEKKNLKIKTDKINLFFKPLGSNRTMYSTSYTNYKNQINNFLPSFSNTNSKNNNSNNSLKNLYKFRKERNFNNKYNMENHIENLTCFKEKTKKIIFEKYVSKIIDDQIKLINEKRKINVNLEELNIFNYENLYNYLKIYSYELKNYLNYLEKTLKNENKYLNELREEKINLMNEILLLKQKFGNSKKLFEININNKFFLICVKNHTNQVNLFKIEDKKDYLNDLNLINNLFNLERIQRSLDKKHTRKLKTHKTKINKYFRYYSVNDEDDILNEIDSSIIVKEQKPIFKSPDEFMIHVNKITSGIQKLMIIYNNKQIQLRELREILKQKNSFFKNEEDINKFYNNEIKVYTNKLNEIKIKNDGLIKYKNNIINEINNSKINNIQNVEIKIKNIFQNLKLLFPIKIKKKFNVPITSILLLKHIEELINNLINYKNYQIIHNNYNYSIIKAEIDKKNKIKLYKELKEKNEKQLIEKYKKVLENQNKIIIKPRKKVQLIYNFNKK